MLEPPYTPLYNSEPPHRVKMSVVASQIVLRREQVLAEGKNLRKVVMLCGMKGTGKSTFGEYAMEHAFPGWLTVRVRYDGTAGRARELYEALEERRNEIESPWERRKRWFRQFMAGEYEEAPEDALDQMRLMVRDTAAALHAQEGTGLAIFVDDLDRFDEVDRPLLISALLAVRGTPAVGIASSDNVQEFADEEPTVTWFDWVTVAPLLPEDVAEALQVPAERVGVRWSEGAIRAVADRSQGVASWVQLMGLRIWQAAAPQAGDEIGEQLAIRIADEALMEGVDDGAAF